MTDPSCNLHPHAAVSDSSSTLYHFGELQSIQITPKKSYSEQEIGFHIDLLGIGDVDSDFGTGTNCFQTDTEEFAGPISGCLAGVIIGSNLFLENYQNGASPNATRQYRSFDSSDIAGGSTSGSVDEKPGMSGPTLTNYTYFRNQFNVGSSLVGLVQNLDSLGGYLVSAPSMNMVGTGTVEDVTKVVCFNDEKIFTTSDVDPEIADDFTEGDFFVRATKALINVSEDSQVHYRFFLNLVDEENRPTPTLKRYTITANKVVSFGKIVFKEEIKALTQFKRVQDMKIL
jgi:hypothetical protein